MIQNSNSFKLKLVLIGDSGVGKSSLLERIIDDQFSQNGHITLGIDFKLKTFSIDGKQVKLQIWNSPGHDRYRSITSAMYRGADGLIFVYDVSDEVSFYNIQNLINELKNNGPSDIQLMLIGNKLDKETREVSTENAQYYAESKQMEFFEVSAKTSDSVTQAFLSLARNIKNKKEAMGQIRVAEQTLNRNQQKFQNQTFTDKKLEVMKDKDGC